MTDLTKMSDEELLKAADAIRSRNDTGVALGFSIDDIRAEFERRAKAKRMADLANMGHEKLLEYYFNSAAAECGGNPNWDMAHEFPLQELRDELLRLLKQKRLVVVGSDSRLLACELRRVVDLLPAKGRDEYLQDMPKDVREALDRNPA